MRRFLDASLLFLLLYAVYEEDSINAVIVIVVCYQKRASRLGAGFNIALKPRWGYVVVGALLAIAAVRMSFAGHFWPAAVRT
jgi:hypothetical protein